MIALDASVLISFWGPGDAHRETAFDILGTEEDLSMHPMTVAESLVGQTRIGMLDDALRDMDRLEIEQHVPAHDEPQRLAALRVQTALKLPDCCVLAAAIELGATLATFDARLASVARDRGLEVVGA